MSSSLAEPVNRFVDTLTPILVGLARPPADATRLRHDVVLDAFNLSCALLAADGRQTDDELWELIGAFGPHLETQLGGATPAAVREAGIVERLAASIDRLSPLFELLVDVDRRDGTAHGRTYYDAALAVAFAMVAVDIHTSTAELEAIERYRGRLLEVLAATEAAPKPHPAPEPPPPEAPPEDVEDLLAELDELVGMDTVKREVRLVADLTRVQRLREERGLPVLDQSRHLVFTGNPGTGKTTVARLLSRIYRSLGVVERGHLVETDRSQLVAGYVGQTATKVRAVFDEAAGGTLLIDEAYALVRGGENDFGREAIDTIVKLVEDRRDSIVVIVAGYPEEMELFVGANPGLRSRFPKTIFFPDYSTDELVAIFEIIGSKGCFELTGAARDKLRAWLDAVPRDKGFGNGRLARNLFEAAVARQATRLRDVDAPTDDQLCTLEESDLPAPSESA